MERPVPFLIYHFLASMTSTTGDYLKCAAILRIFAALRKADPDASAHCQYSWKSVRRLVIAATPIFQAEAEEVRQLLNRTDKSLDRLGDPLDVDYGAHRWLSEEREEAYSDWLAWIIEQLPNPSDTFTIFDVTPRRKYTGKASVERERPTLSDISGASGRMDLVVSFEGSEALVIEVKLGDADLEHSQKLENYSEYLRRLIKSPIPKVILAGEGSEKDCPGKFRLRLWKDVCLCLRRMMNQSGLGLNLTHKALVLAFIGAVEQNLLLFPGNLGRRLKHPSLLAPGVKAYLESAYEHEV